MLLLALIAFGSFVDVTDRLPIRNDKLLHAMAYGTLSLLLLQVLPWWQAALFPMLAGILIEWLQPRFGRRCCYWDVLANGVGILLACGINFMVLYGIA